MTPFSLLLFDELAQGRILILPLLDPNKRKNKSADASPSSVGCRPGGNLYFDLLGPSFLFLREAPQKHEVFRLHINYLHVRCDRELDAVDKTHLHALFVVAVGFFGLSLVLLLAHNGEVAVAKEALTSSGARLVSPLRSAKITYI